MNFNPVNPTHGSIPSEQPDASRSRDELLAAERMAAAVLGVFATLGAFFALLILNAPVSIAAGTAILIGGGIYLHFQHGKNPPDPFDSQCQQIQQKIDRQLVDFNQQLHDQETKNVSVATAFIQKAVNEYNLKKAEYDELLRERNLKNPIKKQAYQEIYDSQLSALNISLSLAFQTATMLLNSGEKARVLAPYQAEYSHLLRL